MKSTISTSDINNSINIFNNYYLNIWYNTSTKFPDFNNTYNTDTQNTNSVETTKYINNIINELNRMLTDKTATEELMNNCIELSENYFINTMNLSKESTNLLLTSGYIEVITDFIQQVRIFNSDILIQDIAQALSNAWVMNSIQLLLNIPVKLTKSIFGYSMLYPYLDNYLDDVNISKEQKTKFNNKIRNWIENDEIQIDNKYENQIYTLLEMIKEQYPRDNKNVYESLLTIQTGQEKSVSQQSSHCLPYEKDIIGISFEKGGTSVLTDGYLVNPNLSHEEARFIYGYGIFLQLLDDLEDTLEDKKNGHMTIFSQLAKQYALDKLTNKLINFIDYILYNDYVEIHNEKPLLIDIIAYFTKLMIIKTIIKNKRTYSNKYIKQIEQYFFLKPNYNINSIARKEFKKIVLPKQTSISNDELKTNIVWMLTKML